MRSSAASVQLGDCSLNAEQMIIDPQAVFTGGIAAVSMVSPAAPAPPSRETHA
jgi:hypothetical protein